MDRPSPYKGDQPYIFISYAHRDSEQVWPIIQRLHNDGYRVWYDEGIDPGTEWDEFIANHIEKCGYLIAFLSDNYLQSDNCKDELNFARDMGKDRLLVYLKDVELPAGMRMRLGRLQAIHWYSYSASDKAMAKLYETPELKQFRTVTPPPPSTQKAKNIPHAKPQSATPPPESKQPPKQAAPDSPERQFQTGIALYQQQRYEEAMRAFVKAAAGGHVAAQCSMGICYEYGRGVKQDYHAAVVCYRKAAQAGDARAQFNLGICLANGRGIQKDLHGAMVCYRQAAKQGHSDAQNSLGVCYANGDGVAQNEAEAVVWFWKAAEQGNARAQYNLGRRYASGQGVAQNHETALSLLRKAADQGHAQARALLAQVYHLKEYQ